MPAYTSPIANLIYPVFRYGLRLKERLRLGRFNMAQEQAELKRLVKSAEAIGPPDVTGPPKERYLGIGYPLACWLDEIFVLDPASPWKDEWRESTLEAALYDSRDRAWKFWQQVEQAESRSDRAALEVCYLCVMLGFRGDLRDDPNRLHSWKERVESHLAEDDSQSWSDKPPDNQVPPPSVPPLKGKENLRWLLLAFGAVTAIALVVLSLAVSRYLLTH